MWDFTFGEMLLGLLGAVVVIGAIVGVCLVLVKSGNKAAAKFKSENPGTATIWIIREQYWGVKIKKSDGIKPKSFSKGITDDSGGTYILPGEHVLTLEHFHADPEITKSAEFKQNKITELKVSLEMGKDYTLQYNQLPGEYKLIEGKPEGL